MLLRARFRCSKLGFAELSISFCHNVKLLAMKMPRVCLCYSHRRCLIEYHNFYHIIKLDWISSQLDIEAVVFLCSFVVRFQLGSICLDQKRDVGLCLDVFLTINKPVDMAIGRLALLPCDCYPARYFGGLGSDFMWVEWLKIVRRPRIAFVGQRNEFAERLRIGKGCSRKIKIGGSRVAIVRRSC